MNFAEYNVKDANLEEVLLALKSLDTVEAVAVGGSRSTGASDGNSDSRNKRKSPRKILFDCRIWQSLLGERGQHGYEQRCSR